MSRADVLKKIVPPWHERRRVIECDPLPGSVSALLDEAATEAPDRIALNFFEDEEQLSYAALRRCVNRLAAGMMRRGIAHGNRVGVMLPNILALPVTWLALARLGAVMVPMNTAYTPREMDYVIMDGDVDWLVIDRPCLTALGGMTARPERLTDDRVFVVGGDACGHPAWEALFIGEGDAFACVTPVSLDDLLNIQYTSGTTGFPKGCMLSHRYWLTMAKVSARRDGRVYERILAATPFFYMDPQWLMLMAFCHRATLFVARRQSASRFMEWVRRFRINFCLFPEIVFRQPASSHDRENEIVRANVYGLHKENHAALEDRFDFIAREAFGMTEIGSGLFMPIEAIDMVGSGSCGVPSPFRQVRVADPDGKTLPVGEVGELMVRGPGMLQGYYNKPEANKTAFHGDWFRTGDLFRQDERGYFYVVGRVKEMIRRAGENIAAREIESVLCALPEIAEAAAVPVPDETRGEEVKACIVLHADAKRDEVSADRIIAHCEARLARFKVPRYIEYRGELPKTASGKIAKHILEDVPDPIVGCYDRVKGCWR